MSNSSCSRVEKKLDKCIKDAPKRGCAEAMAAVAQCHVEAQKYVLNHVEKNIIDGSYVMAQ